MANIFVNGSKSKTGGGKSILNNYLFLLKQSESQDKYFVLTPEKSDYLKYECDFITIVDVARLYHINQLFPLLYYMALPSLFKKHKIDVIFNLGDVIIPTKIKQIYLYDWPYAAYPESPVWDMMDAKSYYTRKLKLKLFKSNINNATIVMAQTKTMKKKLETLYKVKDVTVVPNAVSLENLQEKTPFDYGFKSGKNLVYLSYYYPHKNFEIFIPLAKKIKEKGLDYRIITTIETEQHPKASVFLDEIKRNELEEVIVNIGPVDMKNVPSLYKQADGLIMPTLLESFSGTYVEAMFHKIPIFTSDLDFATDVCGDAGFYFDPFKEDEILEQLKLAFNNPGVLNEKLEAGNRKLNSMADWKQTFELIQGNLESAKNK